MHSNPNDPEPENKSKIFELLISVLKILECSIRLKIDSLTISLSGLVCLSTGGIIFFPLF